MSELFFYSSTPSTIVMAGILQLHRYQRVTQATEKPKHLTEEPYTTTLNTSVASLITDLGVRKHLRSLTLQ